MSQKYRTVPVHQQWQMEISMDDEWFEKIQAYAIVHFISIIQFHFESRPPDLGRDLKGTEMNQFSPSQVAM